MSARGFRFLRLDSPWWFDPGEIRVLQPQGGMSVEEAAQRLVQNELQQPYILETSSERRLHFTQGAVQSVMSLDEPHALVVAYTRKMMAFLLFVPNPRHILMLGLGGGSLPKFCYRHLRTTKITVVESNPQVIALREEFCVPADDQRFLIVQDDGARFISQLAERVEVILVDAFDSEGLAPTLGNSDFYAQAALRLSPHGVLAINLSGEPGRILATIRQVREAFRGSMLVLPVRADGNLILFAFKRRIKSPSAVAYEARARELEVQLPLEFTRYLRRIRVGGHIARSR